MAAQNASQVSLVMDFSLPQKTHESAFWPLLPGQADAYLIHELGLKTTAPICVFTRTMAEAEMLETALRAFLGERALRILTLPDWETLPYDSFSPHEDIISRRIAALAELPALRQGIIIVPISTALHRLSPISFIGGSSISLAVGNRLDIGNYRSQLQQSGYRAVDTVYEHGEYAVRGAILDIFPMGSELPVRIELFDDEIETLRTFDPDTQRTLQKIKQIKLLPAHEYPMTKVAIDRFRQRFDEVFPDSPRHHPIQQDLARGIASPGLEYFLPLFFDHMSTLFDYLPQATCLILQDDLHARAEQFWQEVRHRHEQLGHDRLRPILPPADLFMRVDEFFERCKSFRRSAFTAKASHQQTAYGPLPSLSVNVRGPEPLGQLKQFLQTGKLQAVICAESAGRQQVLLDLLRDNGLRALSCPDWNTLLAGAPTDGGPLLFEEDCAVIQLPLGSGFILRTANIALVAEADLFAERVPQRRRRKRQTEAPENIVQSLAELKTGGPVVHLDHGVGRYLGLVTLDVDGQKQEFLLLAYADDARLYVPVASLHLISRYASVDDNLAPLHRLGNERWSNAKKQALEKIRDTAAELLEVYARRDAGKGHACAPPGEAYRAFAAAFPFEETADQQNAIQAVIADMTRPRPMDRLICGDVGFGKTEVAMRAAFLAAQDGMQVAILVPTTLLAQQHFQSFQDRFAETPMTIELVSRFRSAQDIEKTKKKLADGSVDILIGTHKLLQKDISFKNLGLLIIDEEHRFGVQQKEKVKALRANVDILTLTATPIPRTLNMSMQGLRDLSIIATPPAKRLSVRTFVREYNNELIEEAVLRELLRGGQVFFLHNEVKTIEKRAAELAGLIPDARVAVAHGQLRERDLERVMSDFYHKRFNILVCSTIIETGIDVPAANTIIIERADTFGLAQLHQLRGRVGRSHHQAYAYLLTPPPATITEDARKRLEAISEAQDLGAGFTLATHDLEIRGAGELLGEVQSGHLQAIGFSLYMQLLEEAVHTIKSGGQIDFNAPLQHGCEINLRLPSLIPDDYLPDVHSRLIFYKRIANARTAENLESLQVEMIDRFGLLPDPLKNLFRQTRQKQIADQLGIGRIDLGVKGGAIEFGGKTTVNPMSLVKLMQSAPLVYRLEGGTRLKINKPMEKGLDRLHFLEVCLNRLLKESGGR
jgi:transcription-repair coupling factor (superfamily II helicase)